MFLFGENKTMITAEQFQEWKEHPVTKEVFDELEKIQKALIEQMTYGNTIGHNADTTHGLTNQMVGHLKGLNQLLNISFDDEKIEDLTIDEKSGY